MQILIQWVLEHLSYWVIVLFMAIESSFIPFPSEVIVPPAAWLAATPDGGLNIVGVILCATLGAVLGALVNYALALWLGRPIVYAFANSRFGHMCLIDQPKVEAAEAFFDRHGALSTFVGRLIPAVRQLISIPAGLSRMSLGRFVAFTTLGAAIWNSVLAALGYYCSRIPGLETKEQVVDLAGRYSHEIGYALFAIVAAALAYVIWKGLKGSPAPAASAGQAATPASITVRLDPELPARVELPTSKSISARALVINALAAAPCRLDNLSDCDDTQAVRRAFASTAETIDIGAAGTAMRFLTAYYATREGETHVMTGTPRMQQRPIGILVDALRQLGADIAYIGREGYPPLRIQGRRLQGGTVRIAADVSSQYISALLMIGPTLSKGITLELEGEIASRPYIDMTLRLMGQFGTDASFEDNVITVAPGSYGRIEPFAVEPDWSAASYWFELVALSPQPGAKTLLVGLASNSVQGDSVCARHFEALGVTTRYTSEGALLSRSGIKDLPLTIDFTDCPDLAQTFVVTAAMLGRPFVFNGLKSLKIKETDRIAALTAELAKLGVKIAETAPGRLVSRGFSPAAPGSAAPVIATYDDHRMAMAFAPVAYYYPGLVVEHPEVVSKSYPRFWDALPLL